MNNNDKKVFHNQNTLFKYGNAALNIKLWNSEKYLITKYAKLDDNILDLGVGSGRTSFGMYELGYQNISAIDISSSMIEQAKWINQKLNYKILFEVQDATKLSFNKNAFGFALFSFNGWAGIPSENARIKALKEIFRTLKPGGIYIFSTHLRNDEQYLKNYQKYLVSCDEFKYEIYGDYIFKNQEDHYDFMHLYSLNELLNLIKINTKFQVIKVLDRDRNFIESQMVLEFADNTTFFVLKKPFNPEI
ncbi:class I SAM-dependent methyltransferase [Mycoplasmopsis cynos]|uniref:class I SAM-dependent methyltransferase n=1 Tax=Mycoplasmopsis cynos TaxID=171284 RepID=UPI002AFF1D4D|nr:class I SAM-dependent methyltransferase [Mycoplasmopsis cynos]WQQ15993.1 class I SAM-dependent methyltransferase [Mycoplasmopsis cynos]